MTDIEAERVLVQCPGGLHIMTALAGPLLDACLARGQQGVIDALEISRDDCPMCVAEAIDSGVDAHMDGHDAWMPPPSPYVGQLTEYELDLRDPIPGVYFNGIPVSS